MQRPCLCYTHLVHDDMEQRKSQHLDLVQRAEVEPDAADPLFGCVRLVHRALPELSLDDVDLSTELCGRPLKAPLMVTGMTGGTERAGQINRDLAALAQETGVAFGVGSMRILLDQPELLPTFAVQSRPPLLFANLGAQQLVQRGTDAALNLIDLIKADGIAIHLNAAQELVQEGGDRDFRGQIDAISKLVPRAVTGALRSASTRSEYSAFGKSPLRYRSRSRLISYLYKSRTKSRTSCGRVSAVGRTP